MKAIGYFTNGLGNFMMMMPALQAVASLTDENKIDLCIDDMWRDRRRPVVEEICSKWEIIGDIIRYPKDPIYPQKYDLWYFSPHGSNCDVTILFREQSRIFPIVKPSWRKSLMHEKDHYMEIAYALGYQGGIPKVNFPMSDQPILDKTKRPIIGFCNGAFITPEWQKKKWPYFGRLAEVVRRYFGGMTVGVGDKGELEGVQLDIDYTGSLSITETAKVISQCDLMVTTDTANMHLTWLLDRPLIALFASTLTSKNAPRYPKATILISGFECAPCQDTGRFISCKSDANECMGAITVGDVMAVMKEKIKSMESDHGTHIT